MLLKLADDTEKITGELFYPSIIDMVKIADVLLERSRCIKTIHTPEEFKTSMRKVVKEYCINARKNEKRPLYYFTSDWESSEMVHDLEFLTTRLVDLSRSELTEGGKSFLRQYENQGVFSSYKINTIVESARKMFN